MSHVDDGTLNALVDGELETHERAAVEAHLAVCGDCARRFTEASALARQVSALLTTLDVAAPPVRTTSLPAPVTRARVTPSPGTLRRVAIAASVLLVAGVSYEVGRRDDGGAVPQATFESAPVPAPVVAMRDSNADAVGAAPAASSAADAPPVAATAAANAARQAPVSPAAPAIVPLPAPAPSANAAVVEQLAAPGSDARRAMMAEAPKVAESRRAADATAGFAAATGATAASLTLPGYSSIDLAGADALLRTQFVAPDGVTLVLLVTPDSSTRAARAMTKRTGAFTVTTIDGRSTVTWASQGRTFELRGSLAPDSLLKLATLLR